MSGSDRFPTSEEIYHRILTDTRCQAIRAQIGYQDSRHARLITTPLTSWKLIKDGGDVPWHRVYMIWYDTKPIWDRNKRTYLLDEHLNKTSKMVALPPNMKILSWNLLGEKLDSKETRLQALANKLKELINGVPDILLFQEVGTIVGLVIHDLARENGYGVNCTNQPDSDQNLYILSKATITSMGKIVLGPQKTIIYVDLPLEDHEDSPTVRVYNIHLTSSAESGDKRETQLARIADDLGGQMRIIVGGDFNIRDESIPRLEPQLNDVFKLIGSSANKYELTFDPARNRLAKKSSKPARFDRILIKGMIPTDYNVTIESCPSDHYPVNVSLTPDLTLVGELESIQSQIDTKSDHVKSEWALVAIPPLSMWGEINNYRKKFDARYSAWMPHITLFHPFVACDAVKLDVFNDELLYDLSKDLTIECHEYGLFEHITQETLYLKLDSVSSQRLTQIYDRIAQLCNINLDMKLYVPHITLGKFPIGEANHMLKSRPNPISFPVTQLAWLHKNETGTYEVAEIIHLSPLKPINIIDYSIELLKSILSPYFLSNKLQIDVGGSANYSKSKMNTEYKNDIDMTISSTIDRQIFMQTMIEVLSTCGLISRCHRVKGSIWDYVTGFIYGNIPVDIHYIQLHNGIPIDAISKSDFTIITASQAVLDQIPLDHRDTFKTLLEQVKTFIKAHRAYGQAYGFLPGLAWAIMVENYMLSQKVMSDCHLQGFCKYYHEYDYKNPIAGPNIIWNGDEIGMGGNFIKIILPVSPYSNIVRNLTKRTFTYLINVFELGKNGVFDPLSSIQRLMIYRESSDLQRWEDFLQWYPAIHIRLLLNIDANYAGCFADGWRLDDQGNYNLNWIGSKLPSDLKVFTSLGKKIKELFPGLIMFMC